MWDGSPEPSKEAGERTILRETGVKRSGHACSSAAPAAMTALESRPPGGELVATNPFRMPSSMSMSDDLRRPEGKSLEFKRDLSSPLPVLRTLTAFASGRRGRAW